MSPENIPGLSVAGVRLTIRLGEPTTNPRRPSVRRRRRGVEAPAALRKAA
jgi:hypothetical protein